MTDWTKLAGDLVKLVEVCAPVIWPDSPEPNPHARCIGCGWCCVSGPCMVALVLHPGSFFQVDGGCFGQPRLEWKEGCPSLRWDGQRHRCGAYHWRLMGKRFGFVNEGDHCIFPGNEFRNQKLRDRSVR